jgi:glutamate N-acetyltransferase/amino-acid N-acetyltransferase
MTHPETFLWSGVSSGVKKSGSPDLALFRSSYPATVAGVFTNNSFAAAPVREARKRLRERDQFRGLVVNSGVANAATGQRGLEENQDMLREAGQRLGLDESDVLSASTGHIGRFLDLDRITSSLPEAVDELEEDVDEFAEAITTTDTVTKIENRDLPELNAHMTGVAKGAGMIRPNMATMLAFVFLDHPVDPDWWQDALETAVSTSFNEITVDGEMSTNDTVLAFASDRPDRTPVDSSHDLADEIREALEATCGQLARKIVRDGEGATRTLEVLVQEAPSEEAAGEVADSVANSNLLKSALHGGDPNWGRVYSSIGATQLDLDSERITITLDGYTVYDPSESIRSVPEELKQSMRDGTDHSVTVNLGDGSGSARRLTCDLTEEYVRINSDYEP